MPFVSFHFVLILSTISILQRAFALTDGDLRLANGNTTKGWVEIYYDSRWNTISDQWVIYDISKVVCRQLGLPFSQAIIVKDVSVVRPLDNIGVLATTLFCDGDEARITDCRQFEWSFPSSYTHDNDIGVHCRGEYIQIGDLRLVNGSNRLSGRLEIFLGNNWESICSVGFGVTEATVACHQLGLLNSSDVLVHPDAYFGRGNLGDGPYIAHCNGDEERIESCPSFYRSLDSDNYDELFCSHSQDVGICCPSETDGCAVSASEGSVVGAVVICIVVVVIVLLLIGCCCYCCCKKKKGKQQYTTVVQNPPPQPVGEGQQVSMTPGGNTVPPVYYHGSTPGYPAGTIAPPNTQSYPTQYPPTGQAMPPPAPVGGSTPYPPQPYPYPSGQVPPPAAAGSAPYPNQPYPYPVGQVPQQPGYNPTAAANQYPPQPAAPYPPQTSSMAPPYGVSSAYPTEQSFPTKGDPDHPLPPHTGSGMPSAPPMDTSSGHEEAPSAPPPAYEHLIG